MVSNFKHIWLRVLQESLLYTEHDIASLLLLLSQCAACVVFALPYTCLRTFPLLVCLPVVVSVRMEANGVGRGATGELLPSLHSCCAISMFWAAAVMMSRMMCDVSVEPHQELPSHLYG